MSFKTIDEALCDYLDQSSAAYKKDFWTASSAGQCLRKQYLRRTGVQGVSRVNYSYRMQAYDGDGIHTKIQQAFQKQGILIEAEISLIDNDLHFKGKPDAVIQLEDGKCILDIKTQNQRAWASRKVKGVRTVHSLHRRQVLLYFYFLKKHKYPDLKSARIYYINRNSGEREEFELFFSQQEIDEAINELKELNEYFDKQIVPEMTKNIDDCFFCEYSNYCYKGAPPSKRYYSKKLPAT